MTGTDPRFVDLSRPPAPTPTRPAPTPGGGLNLHDPKVQLGAAGAAAVVLFALYRRKQAAAAAAGTTTATTGIDPTTAAATTGTTGTGPYNSTASDVYNAIEPLFEQLSGIAPQQQATLQQILTQLQNGQTTQTSGSTSTPTPPVAVPPAGAPAGSGWGGSSNTHWFPGGTRTGTGVTTSPSHATGSWG